MTSEAESAITLQDVCRSYRQDAGTERGRALDGVSLTVPTGSWVSLLGPNGSGKSTLLRILATLDRQDEGTVTILGHDPRGDAAAVRGRLGVVFQQPGLDALLSVRENLALEGALGGLRRSLVRERIDELVEVLDLKERVDQRVGTLSGGLARRTDLARALMRSPDLLLLDEPTTGLDPESRRAFIDLLRDRASTTGMTLVMTTHLMTEAEPADLVVMLGMGRIVASGSPSELCSRFGDHVVVVEPAAREILSAHGLSVEEGPDTLIGFGEAEDVRATVDALVAAGATFRHGRPTLDDVYLVRSGQRLAGVTS